MYEHIEVRIANTFEELAAIARFRYEIYVEELAKPLPQADHVTRRLLDAHDGGALHFYVAGVNGVEGCGRLHVGNVPFDVVECLALSDLLATYRAPICYLSKLMVVKGKRGAGTCLAILGAMYRHAMENGAYLSVSTCNTRLLSLYERLGLRVFGERFVDPYVGVQVPLVMLVEDREHLSKTRSVFLDILDRSTHIPSLTRVEFLKNYFFVLRACRQPNNRQKGSQHVAA